jgi:hypothetical protein
VRDPERIRPFLRRLEVLWSIYPDMRFFQLVHMLRGFVPADKKGVSQDCYYTEDDVTYATINKLVLDRIEQEGSL